MARQRKGSLAIQFPVPSKRETPVAEAQNRERTPIQSPAIQYPNRDFFGCCDDCQKIFWIASNYVNHMRDVHGIIVGEAS